MGERINVKEPVDSFVVSLSVDIYGDNDSSQTGQLLGNESTDPRSSTGYQNNVAPNALSKKLRVQSWSKVRGM